MTVYKIIQVVGTSNTSFSDAVKAGIERAGQTLRDLRWFEVKELRGRIADGSVAEYQVKLDVAFHLQMSGKGHGDASESRAARSSTKAEATNESRSREAQLATARKRAKAR